MDNSYYDLKEILREFVKFGDYKLRDKKSNYYVDIKNAITRPKILKLIYQNISQKMIINNIHPDYVACIDVGSVPIGTIVSVLEDLPLIIVRKAEKDYGIKGRLIGDPASGKVVLLLDDVITTGGSIVDAINVLRDKKLIVKDVITIVDREENGKETLAKEGVRLLSLFKSKELMKEEFK